MVVSMLLEWAYDINVWLRLLFLIIGAIAIVGISDNVSITFWFFVYCVLQRTILSVVDAFVLGFPQWTFTVGLIIEIILLIIVIVMDSGDGPICILRGAIFAYENWLASSILARLIYNGITGFSIEDLIFGIILIMAILIIT